MGFSVGTNFERRDLISEISAGVASGPSNESEYFNPWSKEICYNFNVAVGNLLMDNVQLNSKYCDSVETLKRALIK